MCNLSEGIEERGITIGEARGRAVGESTALKLIQLLMKEGRTADIERASTDPEARQKLYQEFHLIQNCRASAFRRSSFHTHSYIFRAMYLIWAYSKHFYGFTHKPLGFHIKIA